MENKCPEKFIICSSCYYRYVKEPNSIKIALNHIDVTSPVTNFHIFRINTTKAGKVSYYINACDVTQDEFIWVSKSIGTSDKSMACNEGFWPKTVRITDKLVYLIGGSKLAINFL